MTIKELAKAWPPHLTDIEDPPLAPAIEDTVLGVQPYGRANDGIALRLRKPDGSVYGACLEIPERLVAKVKATLSDKKELTLHCVGEIIFW